MIALIDAPQSLNLSASAGRSVEELKSSVSGSRLSTWQQCRLKFYYRYVVAIPKATSPALYVGSCIHAVLQAWNLARWRNQSFDVKRARVLFLQLWKSGQEENPVTWEDENKQQEMAWSLIQTYLEQTPIPKDEKPEAVECRVEADLREHGLPKLIGIIDLVRAGGRIVDFKTSATTPNGERVAHLHEMQTSIYAMLYRESTGQTESAIELHHLVKLKTPKIVVTVFDPITDSQQSRLFHCIESYVQGLEREDFVPSPGLQCAWCEFFNECRAWQ